MKVLVTYFTQSGNTEKIAKAICEQAALNHEAELKKLEDATPDDAAGYDMIFIGSPLHSGALAAPVKECLDAVKANPGQKMAGFITHFAPGYPEQDMDGFTEPLRTACREKGIEYQGCFDCQGALTESLHDMVQKKLNLTDEQWADMVKQMTGHPDGGDEENARAFAEKILA